MSDPRKRLIVTSGESYHIATRHADKATARAEIVIADQPGQRPQLGAHPGIALSVEPDGTWKVALTGPTGDRETVATGTLAARPYAWRWPTHNVPQWGQCDYSGVVVGDPAVWAPDGNTGCPNGCPDSSAVAATDGDVKAAPGRTVNLNRVVDLLLERGITAAVEFVGGGAYTVLVGELIGENAGGDEVFELAVGTGWAEPDGRIYSATHHLNTGPHDETLTQEQAHPYTRRCGRDDDEQAIAANVAGVLNQFRADRARR